MLLEHISSNNISRTYSSNNLLKHIFKQHSCSNEFQATIFWNIFQATMLLKYISSNNVAESFYICGGKI